MNRPLRLVTLLPPVLWLAQACATASGLQTADPDAGSGTQYAATAERVVTAAATAIRGAGLALKDSLQPDSMTWMLLAEHGANYDNFGEVVRVLVHRTTPTQTSVRVYTRRRMSTNTSRHDFAPELLRLIEIGLGRNTDRPTTTPTPPSRPRVGPPVTYTSVQYVTGIPGLAKRESGRLIVADDSIRFVGRRATRFALSDLAIDTVVVSTLERVNLGSTLATNVVLTELGFGLIGLVPKTDFYLFLRVAGDGPPHFVVFKTDQGHYVEIGNAIWLRMGSFVRIPSDTTTIHPAEPPRPR